MPKKPKTQSRRRTPKPQPPAAAPLAGLRRMRAFTQDRLARKMRTSQSEVSKLEQRTDTYVSTLRAYVKALGGTLELVAHFPEGDIQIAQFGRNLRK